MKTEFKKKDNSKKFKRYKKKAMATAWNNESDSDSESSSNDEEEKANLAFMANIDEKVASDSSFTSCNESDSDSLEDAFNEPYYKYKDGEQKETHEETTPNFPAQIASVEVGQGAAISKDVAPGCKEDVQMEDAPAQGEHVAEKEAEIQGEPTMNAADTQFQEVIMESTSEGDVDLIKEPAAGTGDKGKDVATKIPLLTRKAHRRSKKKRILVHLKSVIERLDEQGKIPCSVQSDISSIFISQSTGVKELAMVKALLWGMKNELGSMKELVSNLSDLVRVQLSSPAPPTPTLIVPEVPGPSGPSEEFEPAQKASGPPGPSVEESRPPGPAMEESGPSGPVEPIAEQVRVEGPVETAVVPLEPLVSSPLKTPAPPSPPSSSTAPPAPATFK
ncbi:hypothetical protein Taro_033050 [Colocasia esculenta]|uniref:Uncharacterized protein n=1 Tax=Colocasia esculenta TaxID=4460 RepID=A0A843VU95_COLES|nr:hypothetical protein [Colocasia esculenta]